MKRQATVWENTNFKGHIWYRIVCHNQQLKLNDKKANNPIKSGSTTLTSPKKILRRQISFFKKCSTSCVIREMQTLKWDTTTLILEWLKHVDQQELTLCWWECKMAPIWKTVWLFLTKLKLFLPCDSAILFLGYLLKGVENLCPHKKLHKDNYSSFIHHYWNLEATKMPFSRWKDKPRSIQMMEYYSALKRNELSSHEKTWSSLKCLSLSARSLSEDWPSYDILEKIKLRRQ